MLTSLPPSEIAGRYIQWTLNENMESMAKRIEFAEKQMDKLPYKRLPDRVHKNCVCLLVGLQLYNDFVVSWGGKPIDVMTNIFDNFLKTLLLSALTGRTKTAIDEMLEDIVNDIASGTKAIPFYYFVDNEENTIWFHFAPAHKYWAETNRRTGGFTLEREAMERQLHERGSDYYLGIVS